MDNYGSILFRTDRLNNVPLSSIIEKTVWKSITPCNRFRTHIYFLSFMAENEFVARLHAPQSQLTSQFRLNQGRPELQIGIDNDGSSSIRPADITVLLRPRSSHEIRPPFGTSPFFVEPAKRSKDDIHLALSPVMTKRPSVLHRGLSLQMPPRDISSTSTANLTRRVPLSPKLDSSTTYATPASVLPRRSRGLDFSRSCTNLHHSTLAEQSSPDSSPIIGHRGGMTIPRRTLLNPLNIATSPGSPGSVPNSLWSTMAGTEKSVISSSVGSVNMMDYDSGGTTSDEDDLMGHVEDEDILTPQVHKTEDEIMGHFEPPPNQGGDGVGFFSPAAAKLMSFQRALFNKKERSKRGSKTGGINVMQSPGPPSPPLAKSIESSCLGGAFSPRISAKHDMGSRRESLSLGTKDLNLSDREESDEGAFSANSNERHGSSKHANPSLDDRKNVIRRAVTRRGNMLPKSKNFARIRAALQEESAPVDTEIRREAEVIRQVRESDTEGDLSLYHSQPTTTASSPSLHATAPTPSDSLDLNSEDLMMGSEHSISRRSSSSTFTNHAIRNSGGLCFWNTFDERMRTPPPILIPRGSSAVSDDVNMDNPLLTTPQQTQMNQAHHQINSQMTTPQANTNSTHRKGNKRMRDDDFDPNFFKRRAVSPALSLQNSPILPQSPSAREGGSWWGSKANRETPNVHIIGERVSSGGSSSSTNGTGPGPGTPGPSKRVGFQGMSDTNDGLMNMSIE